MSNCTLSLRRSPTISVSHLFTIAIVVLELCVSGLANAGEPGNLTYEVWNNVTGSKMENLTERPQFHGGADSVTLIDGAVAPSNVANNFGSRLRGYVIAPVAGDYTFWESGDDAVDFYFSEDDNKFNVERIAWHSGWTNPQQWDKFESQKSQVFRLQAGQKCYVELRQKEAVGSDNLAMAWSYYEVQDGLNLTQLPGAIATQSTTYGTVSVANNAIDGNADGDTASGDPITHTQGIAGSWWQVDLGAMRSVDRLVLWNREGWNGRRLSNFKITLLDDDGTVMRSQDFHTDGTHVGRSMEWALNGAVNAQTIRVERIGPSVGGENILSLAELEAFGVEQAQPLVNMALFPEVIANQSSTYPGGSPENAIDGNTSGVTAAGDPISHTRNEAGAWWQLNLGQMRPIEKLILWNRSTWKVHLSNFRVSLLDTTGNVVLSKDYFTDGTHAGATVEWDIDGVVRAQTVRVEKLGPDAYGSNFICLAEVEVFGVQDRLAHVSRQVVDSSALESYDIDPLDLDDDDLVDAWEITYGFDTSTWQDGDFAYGSDSDTDYLTNFDESQLGLDPFLPDSLLGYFTLEQRFGVDHYSVREAAAQSNQIYQTADKTFLVEGASTGEEYRRYFAQRMRGYITAPETGDYRFWISATDGAQLLISTGEDKFHKRLIAELGPEVGTGHGLNFSAVNKWDRYVSQMSEEIHLAAGQKYFVEVQHQHGHGRRPHASIAWARPGAEREEIPSEFTSSYFPVATDADDDSLLDTWEAQYGLSLTDNGLIDRAREGERGDFDSDGLNNLDEYLAGTNPSNSDTDGDGLSDADELRSHGTNPLISDAPDETIASTLDLESFTSADSNWSFVDGGLLSDTFRGNISWDFSVPASGAWVIQVDTRIRGSVFASELVHVNASIDGQFIGRYALLYGVSHKAIIRVLSLDLSVGTHSLTLEVDSLLGRRMVQIDSISLRQPSGIDLDGDGIPDWIESQLAQSDFVVPHATTSRTSPFCLEGRARIRDSLLLNAAPVLAGGDAQHWYANLSLLSSFETSYTIDFANGQQVQGEVYWWATNVLDNETLTIREGDSLRLAAWIGNGGSANTEHPNKKSSQGNGVVTTITVDGVAHTLGNSRDTHNHQFDTAGTYQITATHVTGATGTLTVIVRHSAMPDDTTVVQNTVSYWTLQDTQADRALFFEAGDGLNLGVLESVDDDSYQFRFYPQVGGYLGVVSRLWEGGPILDVADVISVTVTDALQNSLSSTFPSQDFPGYYLISTPMVVLDLPPGAKVVITIFRSGVTFPDGTKKKTYYAEDFVNGIVNLEFLMPIGTNGGYCHYISIYDANGTRIGSR